MEVSVVARQASAAGSDRLMLPVRSRLQLLAKQRRRCALSFSGTPTRTAAVAGLRCRRRVPPIRAAIRSEAVSEPARKAVARKESSRRSAVDRPQLFVGLPVDAVSDCNTLNHPKAIAFGLKALRLLGVDGVELPVWWGVAEKEAMGKYDWSGYLALVQVIRDAGLQVRASLYFHASAEPDIPLPQWVSAIGDADPDIFFTDRAGKRHRGCLSVAVDDLPVLQGKTPMQVYGDFLHSFRTTFSQFLGSTITDILVGLGPDGELKYPSLPQAKNRQAAGVGEFQCYDKNMLNHLKQHAESNGNHYWGLSGPHDTPHYHQSPDATNFFKENGGSWETPYGNFFLSWYSQRLLSHADRLLSVASAAFGDLPVTLYGKLPVMHAWYNSRSHPSELAAGFFNTAHRDGYDAVAEAFARHSCGVLLPSMDLSDRHQPRASRSSPESLLSQIMRACKRHGVAVAGENSGARGVPDSFGKIKETLSRRAPSPDDAPALVDKFTYQRMGAHFFSPEHFPLFTQFVRSLDWSDLHPDDQPAGDGETIPLTPSSASEGSRQMQAV
uniref:Beta-amylase n=1 Tax=Anthurium amnicola TaxID=1678845 RepID=A0A1D1YDE4_9ARAE